MNIAVVGAGAMGSLLASYLCAHANVWLLDPWQAHIAAINARGLRRECDGAETITWPRATTDPAQIGACDVVLVLVKAQQTAWAAQQAHALLSPQSSVVVTLQNGVGNRELLATQLGPDRVGQGVTALGATLLGAGRVRHAGHGATVFGAAPHAAAMQSLAALFNACGLPAELSDDLDALVWGKLIVNVGINALSALLRVPNGALSTTLAVRELVALAVAEAVAVAEARGTTLPYAEPLAHVFAVAAATGANRSSMLQDVLRGSPTESATINGAIVHEGQRLGVATPVNALLTALLGALDATVDMRVS